MKTYTIIGGVNGVGKSSFTGVLKERSTDLGIIVDVDKITAELGAGAIAGGLVNCLCTVNMVLSCNFPLAFFLETFILSIFMQMVNLLAHGCC